MLDRFDPASPLPATPPFVRWTLALACPLRETIDGFDPEQTERLLRGVRCYSDALEEGRVREGTVVQRNSQSADTSLGFKVQAVLEPLGGEAFIRQTCSACPANALRSVESAALAGCVGVFVPPHDNEELWRLLTLHNEPSRDALLAQVEPLRELSPSDALGLTDYLLALGAAIRENLPLIVHAYPAGRCEGRRWFVDAHCGRCKASWPEARRQECRACGHVGGRQAERRRMRIGTRPYRPLRDFLTAEEIAGILK